MQSVAVSSFYSIISIGGLMKKIFMIIICCFLFSCQENLTENNVIATETLQDEVQVIPVDQSNFSSDDLIYFIMIDRFFDGNESNNQFPDFSEDKSELKSYLGGDLQGIIQKLDYIKEQGATAIWITPVAKNEPYGYHGYWTEDFTSVDPHFGDIQTLKQLVKEAHDKDMKVILDYVVNHTGYRHPWLNDPEKKDWFHNKGTMTNYNDEEQVLNYNLAGLPDLNTENQAVKDYFFENVMWWIEETQVDGLRLDTVRHVPNEFWLEFNAKIKEKYPDFFLLGEVFVNSPSFLASYSEIGFDSVTNYSMYNGIKDTFKIYGDANNLKIAINNDKKFNNFHMNSIFLDNHDVARLISRTSKEGDSYLKQGITFILTYPSIPIIYYGTEIGLEGGHDPDNRQFMNFDELNNDMYNHYHKILELREMTRDYTHVEILDVKSNHIVIEYSNDETSYLTAFNVSKYPVTLTFDKKYVDYMTGQTITGEFELEPLATLILMEE